jgi:hypothetical protein
MLVMGKHLKSDSNRCCQLLKLGHQPWEVMGKPIILWEYHGNLDVKPDFMGKS